MPQFFGRDGHGATEAYAVTHWKLDKKTNDVNPATKQPYKVKLTIWHSAGATSFYDDEANGWLSALTADSSLYKVP
jgi:hypothetical protein